MFYKLPFPFPICSSFHNIIMYSRLCGLLSQEDSDVLEYWNDLKQYTKKG